MPNKSLDILIIGQGLAGSLLAVELLARGLKLVIVDDGRENASQVAAGLINPVTGRRLVKSADTDDLLQEATRRYAQLAAWFGQDFFRHKPMLRLFRSDAERRLAQQRRRQPGYGAYLGELQPPMTDLGPVVAPFGFLVQQRTGQLLTRPLLNCLKAYFIEQDCYRSAEVHADDIQLTPLLRWREFSPRRIVFCEGYRVAHNPWFSWLPLQAAQGEILTLTHRSALPDALLNYGHWLAPIAPDLCRIGATFDTQRVDTDCTASAQTRLLDALRPFCAELVAHGRIVAHHAQIRPCTLDKQPFIGLHPRHPQLAIFNGFGSKGSLQIPWYSRRFAAALLDGAPMPADIKRYHATHFPD